MAAMTSRAETAGRVLFGYSRDARRAFSRPVADDGRLADYEIWNQEWRPFDHAVTACAVGGRVFVVGMGRDGRPSGGRRYGWFVRELLPDGTMGEVTQTGDIDRHYGTLCAYVAGGRTYVFCHAARGGRWFIREMRADGTFGPETHGGGFGRCCSIVCTIRAGTADYLFGAGEDDFWFIQRLNADDSAAGRGQPAALSSAAGPS
jgi:hypothetical protein